MSRTTWAAARVSAGAAILAVLLWRLGTGPIRDGLASIDLSALIAAFGLGVLVTVASACRWRLIARGLGVDLRLRTAVAAYYRSQLLNIALPGGVLGDVHRAVRHGQQSGELSRSVRAVAWERTAGQLVQVALALVVLLALPSPVRASMPLALAGVLLVALGAGLLVRVLSGRGPSRWARTVRVTRADLRNGLGHAWPGVLLAAGTAIAGHAATFLVAARTAGSSAPISRLLPLAMLVLLAMAVPANIGGWGPREGAAAWLFAAAGLGAGQGVATATVYGVLVAVASLPGVLVLIAPWLGRYVRLRGTVRSPDDRSQLPCRSRPAVRWPEGAVRG